VALLPTYRVVAGRGGGELRGGAARLVCDTRQAAGEGGIGGAPDAVAVRCGDDEDAAETGHSQAGVVDEAVVAVAVAQQDEVRQVGAAAEQPVPHVVGVQTFDAGLLAARTGAAAVPAQEGHALSLGGAPFPPTDGQGLAALFEHGDHGCLAQHPPGHGRRQGRPALEIRAAGRGVIGEDGGVDVHDDLPARWIAGAAIGVHGGLGQRGQRGEATRGDSSAGQCHLIVAGAARSLCRPSDGVSARTLEYESCPSAKRSVDPRPGPQRAGDADVLPGRAGGQAALPGEPVRAGRDAPAVPPLALVELGDQPQPDRGRRRQPDGTRGDRRGEVGERTAGRVLGAGELGHGASFERVIEG
jgi:hypothetical protein